MTLLAAGAVGFVPSAFAAPKKCSSIQTHGKSRVGHFYGISRATARCDSSGGGSSEVDPGAASAKPYQGTPPLINNGGPVMSTPTTGNQVVVMPVFWAPPGYSFTTSYKNVIDTYLTNLAHDSDTTSNVFASTFQYGGSNGNINYRMSIATSPILDADAYPAAGCTTNAGGVYADGTGYSSCLDDAQVETELSTVISTNHLTTDLGHLVVMFLPKGVESCFFAGNSASQQCTLNSTPSAAYCAYHSAYGAVNAPKVYALMPFPAYQSPTGYTCAGEGLSNSGPAIQAPNGDADADAEISPLSHEMAESITDPEGNAWLDSSGNENGDDCAYIYGALSGSPGSLYNQVVNGAHYLTQEEFSNAAYVANTSGCVQNVQPTLPTVSGVSPTGGAGSGGGTVTITGTGFAGASAVSFGVATSSTYTVNDPTSITATVPGGGGVVDVTVTTGAGTSATNGNDKYTYTGVAPTVTSVSPSSGPVSGGGSVTITGTNLSGATGVVFGGNPSPNFAGGNSQISASVPAGAVGTVDITVTTTGGASTATAGDQYTYVGAPTVTAVSPRSGPSSGGQSLTVTGTGFGPGATVTVGGTLAGAVNVVSATQLTVTTPSHLAGTVDVTVTTGGGTTATSAGDRYTYLAPHSVSQVSPNSGPTAGGTSLTISGTGFAAGDTVKVGGTAATSVVVVSSTSITARVPSHTAGTVDVRVTSLGGSSAPVNADHYSYLGKPHVSRLSSRGGTASGGQTVTIRGSGFVPGTTVRFGTIAGTSVKYLSATRLTVRTPRHSKRTVNVIVRTRGGSSARSTATHFTFR
jgi:hypothetical protein